MTGERQKVCKKCGKVKPKSAFYTHDMPDRFLRRVCSACSSPHRRETDANIVEERLRVPLPPPVIDWSSRSLTGFRTCTQQLVPMLVYVFEQLEQVPVRRR